MRNLSSLTIFFPFLNDEKTVFKMITQAYLYGMKVTKDLEVIAIHGGPSRDNTYAEIKRMKKKFPKLIVVDKRNNKEGYAVIKYGFLKASKDWVFYTDGDGQYDLKDLKKLVDLKNSSGADIVCGYKTKRHDPLSRIVLGNVYRFLSRIIFDLPIRDVDCDFRLIKKKYLDGIRLESEGGSVLPELIVKLKINGARFAEVPVSHYKREYGSSNYSVIRLIYEKLFGDFSLYWKIRKANNSIKVVNETSAPK